MNKNKGQCANCKKLIIKLNKDEKCIECKRPYESKFGMAFEVTKPDSVNDFSNFIRNGSKEEKERIYKEVIREANAEQKKIMESKPDSVIVPNGIDSSGLLKSAGGNTGKNSATKPDSVIESNIQCTDCGARYQDGSHHCDHFMKTIWLKKSTPQPSEEMVTSPYREMILNIEGVLFDLEAKQRNIFGCKNIIEVYVEDYISLNFIPKSEVEGWVNNLTIKGVPQYEKDDIGEKGKLYQEVYDRFIKPKFLALISNKK